MEDDGSKYADWLIVDSVYLHFDWNEITFCQAELLNGFESCKAALTAGVCHSRDSDRVLRVIYDSQIRRSLDHQP